MATIIKNDTELIQAIMKDMVGIIDEVAEKLLEILKDKIKEIVYDANYPAAYDRQGENGGLLGMWDKSDPVLSGRVVEATVSEFAERLNHDPEHFIHGSFFWTTDDIRDILVDIVTQFENRHMSGDLFGEEGFWRDPRDFWTPILELIENKGLEKYVEKGFKKRGIRFKKA